MSTNTREPSQSRRRNRVYGSNDLPGARLSDLSLISNTTAGSNSSGGSMSTVTQDSILKPHRGSEKRKKVRRPSDASEGVMEKRALDHAPTPKDVDVFEFLVEESSTEKVQPEMEMTSSISVPLPKQEAGVNPDDPDYEGYYRSQLSDSGISMGSSFNDSYTEGFTKHPLPPLIEEINDYSTYVPTMVEPFYPQEPHLWGHLGGPMYTPEPIPLSPASIRSYAYPQEYAYRGTPDPPSTGDSSVACLDTAPLVFRDKRNKKTQHPHIFRSFAHLNQKVLLQMQSNITDLEQELAALDAKAVAAEIGTRSKRGENATSSRHFTKDQSRRADLYQELHVSLEQYYDALSSFHQINQISTPCVSSEHTNLKSWLQSYIAPSSKILALVGDGSDLVQFGRTPHQTSEETLRVIAYGVFANIFIPLLLFKLTSGVLWRLISLALTTTVATLIMDRHRASTKAELGDLHWHCIIGCASVSLFAALLF